MDCLFYMNYFHFSNCPLLVQSLSLLAVDESDVEDEPT